MSNDQAKELFVHHKPAFMSHLFLSHLSRDNNSPKLVRELFKKVAGPTEIVIASRDKETRLYHIRSAIGRLPAPRRSYFPSHPLQLGLFH
jgi:hypothetical protein